MASYSSFFNEDGEPLMSGEDMRAEMAADAYDEPWQYEYDDDDLSDGWDEPEDEDTYEDESFYFMEDEHLDGSYED